MIPLWPRGLRCHLGMNPGLLGLQHTTCCWKCSCLGTSWESLCTEIMCSNNFIFIEVNTTYYLCICHCVDWNLLKDRWLRSSLLKGSPSRNCGLVINFIKDKCTTDFLKTQSQRWKPKGRDRTSLSLFSGLLLLLCIM